MAGLDGLPGEFDRLAAAIAGRLTSTLAGMMGLAAVLSMAFTTVGLALSYGPDLD